MTDTEYKFTDHTLDLITAFTGAFVAVAVIVMTCITTWFLLSHEIPKDNQTIVGQLQGSLWTSLGVIVGYFYVSSANSRIKDKTIGTMAATASSAQDSLPSNSTDTVTLKPGDIATVTPTDAGTTIDKEPSL